MQTKPDSNVGIEEDISRFQEVKVIDEKVKTYPKETKSPGLAAVLSCICPGLGQVYNEQIINGIVIFIATLIGLCLFLLPGLIVWVFGIYDARNTARSINSREIQA